MKKLIALLLVLSMATTVVACGNGGVNDDSKTESQKTETESTSESESESETETESETPLVITPGQIEGAIYSNPSLEVAWTMPGGWNYYTTEELLAENDITSGTLEEAYAAAEEGEMFYDMYATNPISYNAVSLSSILSSSKEESSVTEKALAEEMNKETDFASSFTEMGYTDVESTIAPITIGNEEHMAIHLSGVAVHSNYYMKLVFIQREQYILVIMVATSDENVMEDLLNSFYFGENAKAEAIANYREIVPTLGKINGSTFENPSLGYGWTLPEGWTFYDQDTMLLMNGLTNDLTEEQLTAALQAKIYFSDMYAVDATGSSVNIQVQKMNKDDMIGSEFSTVYYSKDYIELSFSMMGAENLVVTQEKFPILGREHHGLYISCSILDSELYERVVCVQIDQYFITITAATSDEDKTAELLSAFYSLEE